MIVEIFSLDHLFPYCYVSSSSYFKYIIQFRQLIGAYPQFSTKAPIRLLMVSYMWAYETNLENSIGKIGRSPIFYFFAETDNILKFGFHDSFMECNRKIDNSRRRVVYSYYMGMGWGSVSIPSKPKMSVILLKEYCNKYLTCMDNTENIGSIPHLDVFIEYILPQLSFNEYYFNILSIKFSIKILHRMAKLVTESISTLVTYNDAFSEWHNKKLSITKTKNDYITEFDTMETFYKKIENKFGLQVCESLEANSIVQCLRSMLKSETELDVFCNPIRLKHRKSSIRFMLFMDDCMVTSSSVYFMKIFNRIVESYVTFGFETFQLFDDIKFMLGVVYKTLLSNGKYCYPEVASLLNGMVTLIKMLHEKLKYVPGGIYYEKVFTSWKSKS